MIGQEILRNRIQVTKGEGRRRKRLRLEEYDYSQPGAYFLTICTKDRKHLFGKIGNGRMFENNFGAIAKQCWEDLPNHYPNIEIDAFVVMPNHVHAIVLLLDDAVGEGFKPSPTNPKRYSLTEIVRAFKTFSARRINEARKTPGVSVWQRNYFEHIIRNEFSLNGIREYIFTNPERWEDDKENDEKTGIDTLDSWLDSEGKGCLQVEKSQ